jgi:hypothetical protein
MSFTAPSRVFPQPRRTPLATPSPEASRTDRASLANGTTTPPAPPSPEPHWQATIESATD